jgi:hypothetical protein
MMGTKTQLAVSLLAALAAREGLAGVVIQARLTSLKDQSVMKMTTLFEAERLRMDIADAKSDVSLMLIRRGGDFEMIMLDRRLRQYHVMDRASLRQMSQELASAMAQIQEQLKDLPPEQRALMERMMGKQAGQLGAGAAAAPTITFRAAGAGSASGRSCKKYEAFQGASKVGELCAVAPQSLGLSAADMAAFEKLSEVFEEFGRAAGQHFQASQVKLADKQIDGFPIEWVWYEAGRPAMRYEVLDVTRRSFSEADFSTGDAKRVATPLGGVRK